MRVQMIPTVIFLAAGMLAAQTFRGTILGTVTDPSGAVLSGAKVTVRNLATGLERTTLTSADGSYAVPELPIGTYTVTVTQSGFQTSVISGVVVDVASERRVDSQLKTGQVATVVEVTGETGTTPSCSSSIPVFPVRLTRSPTRRARSESFR